MFTGRDALFSIEQSIGKARADESRLEAALNSAVAEAARLRRQEADAFRALARAKLDLMMRDEAIGRLDQVERRALDMIEGHRQAIEDLSQRRDKTQTELDTAEAAKHDRDQELADALEKLDDLGESTHQRLEADSDAWKEAKTAVEAAEAVAANADEKAGQAEADLADKRQPYEADPIFMYLWNKKHGQSEDTSGTLVRYFDRKVAHLIGYREARANYAMLQEIPLRLREHANQKQADVDAARQGLAGIERQALVADGVEKLEARLAEAESAAKAAGVRVEEINAAIDDIEAKRQQAMDVDENVAFDQAVNLLTEALSQDDLRQLYDEARRTTDEADDRAIAAIGAARDALNKTDAEVVQIRSEIREMARRRTELEEARNRARSQGYDNPRGTFGDAGGRILGEVLGEVLRGAATGAILDGVFRDNYRPPRRRSGTVLGGSSGAPSWPRTWGRSGTSRSAPKGSGGWRTGGRF